MGRKEKNFRWEELSPDDRMKYEIAEELGLLEKVQKERNEESFHNTQILQNVRFMYRKRLSASCRTENPV